MSRGTHPGSQSLPSVVRLPAGEEIQRQIYRIRGQKVMIDSDLAELYDVSTKSLNQQVRRNKARFPPDFMFQLTPKEMESLRSQFVTSNEEEGRGGRRYLPLAFTEQGIAMLSGVLRSERAVQVNIAIMRAFVRLRRWMVSHREMSRRLDELEERYDDQFKAVFQAIRCIMAPDPSKLKRIGFHASPATKAGQGGS